MNVRRIVPDIQSTRLQESRQFYVQLFGLRVAMDMGTVVTLASASNETAQITLIRDEGDSSPHKDVGMTVEVDDVDRVYALAIENGSSIVYPLTTEPWGVRRFFVSDPNGIVINVMSHRKEQ